MALRNWLRMLPLAGLTLAGMASAVSVLHVFASASEKSLPSSSFVQRAPKTWKVPARSAEFSEVPHSSAPARCEDTQPPEALTTPAPLLGPAAAGDDAKVSFIVGTDGRVHSPLILKSAGSLGDRHILQTVGAWRYRPATCNGVPTEAEGRIEFSRR